MSDTLGLDTGSRGADPRSPAVLELHAVGRTIGHALVVSELSFSVGAGEVVSLLGPSGSGKTTTLRMIAGLDPVSSGEIRLGGEVVSSREPRKFVAPEKRNLGMVFQSYALWPHMTVRRNVDYCLQAHRFASEARERRVRECLELVGLATLAERYPAQLSGGEQQRVALARAISYHPRLLLLDEPLSNIDPSDRERVRGELRKLLRSQRIATLLVTHDQNEAMSLSDRVVLLKEGRKVEEGTPVELYEQPKSLFTARFVGLSNVLSATCVRDAEGRLLLDIEEIPQLHLPLPESKWKGKAGSHIALRPSRLELVEGEGPEGTASVPGEVREVEYLGGAFQYRFQVGNTVLRVTKETRAQGEAPIALGPATLVVPSDAITVLSD